MSTAEMAIEGDHFDGPLAAGGLQGVIDLVSATRWLHQSLQQPAGSEGQLG